jgi:hypothetical protein
MSVAASPAESAPLAVEATSAAEDPLPTSTVAVAPQSTAVSFQSIANAYGDLTRHSLDQTKSFLEKLAGVKSIDKAFELHTDFARQAYDNFVTGSQKIRELHREMAKQKLERWEDLVIGITKVR